MDLIKHVLTKKYALAFDTTATQFAVALVTENGEMLDGLLEPHTRGGERLHLVIDDLLRRNGLLAKDICLVVVPSGPGSFTGVRLGMAAGQGFAMALGVPVVGVPTFEAMVRQYADGARPVTFMANAHGGMVYHQIFDAFGAPQTEPSCIPREKIEVEGIVQEDKPLDVVLLGQLGLKKYRDDEIPTFKPMYIKKLDYKKIDEQPGQTE